MATKKTGKSAPTSSAASKAPRASRAPKARKATASAEAPAVSLTIPVRNLKAETIGEATLPAEIFGVAFREHVVWETVKSIRAAEHRGTHKTKVRSEVSGTGKKPFKQKHTGRARQGGGRPPIHRHGGTVFGPTPHAYDLKVNARAKKAALRCVLSEKVRENRFFLLESLDLPTYRTRDLVAIAKALGIEGKALLVDSRSNENLARAASNNPKLEAVDALGLNVYDALNAGTLVFSEDALRKVTEVLG
jgi:large subunit ribosomal protein L4